MIFLKHEKTLYEVDEKEAKEIVRRIAASRPVPFGLQVFKPFTCEILEKLPFNYEDFEIVYKNKQIGTLELRNQERDEMNDKWQAEQKKLKNQTPEQKAQRECEAAVKTNYRLRAGFQAQPPQEWLEKVKKILIAKFTENPKLINSRKEWYEKLLPVAK